MNPLMKKMLESGFEHQDTMLIRHVSDDEIYSFKFADVAQYKRDNDPYIVGLSMMRRDDGDMSVTAIDADLDPFTRELRLTMHDYS